MNYLLPQRLPITFFSPANIPSPPSILATLSFRGSPSAMYLTHGRRNLYAHLKLEMEHLCHIFKAGILAPLSQESGFMPWSLWNAACHRACTHSTRWWSLVHLVHKGNIIPDRCLPTCQWWRPSVMEKPRLSQTIFSSASLFFSFRKISVP